MATQSQSLGRSLFILLVIVVVGMAAYAILNKPDDRNAVQKVGDAIQKLPEGGTKAARELQDRTPADRISDSVKDEKNKIENNGND